MFGIIVLFSIMFAIFALVGGLIGGFYGAVIAIAIALMINLIAWWGSDSMILGLYQAKPTDDYKIKEMVKKLAREAKIPEPKLYIIKTSHFMPNAFSTGRSMNSSAIAVTGSLLHLKDDEINAVLAHEIGHIRNKDTTTMMLAAALGGAIAYIAQMAYWYLIFEGGDTREGTHILGMVAVAIFAPLAAFMIRMAISRQMEYRADYFAALITKRPRSLVRALEKISDAVDTKPLKATAATSHLWIVNPLRVDFFTKLFWTHPPVKDRMKRLLELEGRVME